MDNVMFVGKRCKAWTTKNAPKSLSGEDVEVKEVKDGRVILATKRGIMSFPTSLIILELKKEKGSNMDSEEHQNGGRIA